MFSSSDTLLKIRINGKHYEILILLKLLAKEICIKVHLFNKFILHMDYARHCAGYSGYSLYKQNSCPKSYSQ